MGISAAVFESAGKRTEHYIPGVYSRSNNVSSSSGVSAGNLCIMGKSAGGEPQKLLSFSTLGEAKEDLVSGDLLQGVAHAFNCSPDYAPQKVYAMRVNPGTQSSRTVYGSQSAEVLEIVSWDWGVHCNQLKMKLTSGTKTGSYKVVLSYKGSETSKDNIMQKSILISLVDQGSSGATVTINADGATLTAISESTTTTTETVGTGEYETVDVTDEETGEVTQIQQEITEEKEVTQTETVTKTLAVSFDEVSFLSELVDRINDYVDDSGNAVFAAALLDTSEEAKAAELDYTSVSLTVDDSATLYSNVQAIAEALEAMQYVGGVEILSRVKPDADAAYQYFTGGTEGTYTASDWSDALTALEVEDVQIISTPSTDSSVQVLIANHCSTMSSTENRKERTCILGGALNESVDDAVEKAGSYFASKYVSYVCDSIYATNPITGDSETLAGSYLACKLAGLESAMSVDSPLTNKTLSVTGFTQKRRKSEWETMIAGGVLPCGENEQGDLVVIRAMTTYQGDDLMSCERSMVREDLYMNRDLRQAFTPQIGKSGAMSASFVADVLQERAKIWASRGYITPTDDGANVWDISVRVDGDKTYLTFSRYLAAPRNFIFITANNYTYSTSTVEI